jgi:hypothetical protein
MVYPEPSGDSNAHAHFTRIDFSAGYQALVAVARALHLPAAASARAAHPHST